MRAPIAERHSARGWTPFSAGVFAIVALLLGSNLPNPLFPLYAKTFGLSPLDITLVFATYTLLVIPALILLAPPSDARGRRPARQRVDRRRRRHGRSVRGGYGCRLAVRRAGRAGVRARRAARDGGAGARRGDPSENVRRSAAIASAATLAGAALGPLLAGFLAQYGPLSPRLPYLVEIALLVWALGAARLLPEAREPHRYRPRRPEIPREIRRRFGLASVSAFVGWAVTGLYLALIPSFVTTVLRHDLASAGAVLTLMLAASAVTAAFSHRLPSLPTQLTGMVTMGLSIALLVGAAELRSLGILLVATVTAGTGQGLTFMGSLADVNEMAPADRKANTVAGYYVVVYLGTALPVVGVGALAGPLGLISAIDVFAAVVLAVCLGGIAALVMERWGRPVVSAS